MDDVHDPITEIAGHSAATPASDAPNHSTPSVAPEGYLSKLTRALNDIESIVARLRVEFGIERPAPLTQPHTPEHDRQSKIAALPVALSDPEEREFSDASFRCRWPMHVTGRRLGRGSNVLHINGHEVLITDKPFRLFLRLVVALHERPDGWVSTGSVRHGGGLADEGYYTSDGLEQAWSRLRGPLRAEFNSLIERSCGRVRLSTHRRFVTWDAERLADHDADVRLLAERLPPSEV